MAKLITRSNTHNPDDIYQTLIELHQGMTSDLCLKTSAKLILLLANHIGDDQVIKQAIELAKPVRKL